MLSACMVVPLMKTSKVLSCDLRIDDKVPCMQVVSSFSANGLDSPEIFPLWTKDRHSYFFGNNGLLAEATSQDIWQKTTGLRSATGMLQHSSSSGLEGPLQLWMLTAIMRLFSHSGNKNTRDLELHLCCNGIIMLTGHLANHFKVLFNKTLISRY